MSAATTTQQQPCGCSGSKTVGASACSCGCGGCDACSAGPTATKTGTHEATERSGTVSAAKLEARPNFFAGELVTDEDLDAIVRYQRNHAQISNRSTAGWGVFCGYDITIDPKKCCLIVSPGVAYDACGRALVGCGAVLKQPEASGTVAGDAGEECKWLAVVYDDSLEMPRPRYSAPCGPSADPGCDYARVKERVRFVWLDEEPSDEYWLSGCLPDPCGESPPGPDPDCPDPETEAEEPPLDRCTPDSGIRGGVGMLRYQQALAGDWNLQRNLSAVADDAIPCESGLGAILDVIGSQACRPCAGEPLVVLAKVCFGPPQCPSISVEPLRRRVLSNADLTFLLFHLMERVVCDPPAWDYRLETEPPMADATCGPERAEDEIASAKQKAQVALPRAATSEEREAVAQKFLWRARVANKWVRDLTPDELILDTERGLGKSFERAEREEIRARLSSPGTSTGIHETIDRLFVRADLAPSEAELEPLRAELFHLALDEGKLDVEELPESSWKKVTKFLDRTKITVSPEAEALFAKRSGGKSSRKRATKKKDE